MGMQATQWEQISYAESRHHSGYITLKERRAYELLVWQNRVVAEKLPGSGRCIFITSPTDAVKAVLEMHYRWNVARWVSNNVRK